MDTWQIPYTGTKTTKCFARCKPGIYIIRDAFTKAITYIGMSKSNVYKAMYRHFQQWNDRSQYRVTYPNRTGFEVRLIIVPSEKVDYTERRLIRFFNPRDNAERYEDSENYFFESEQEAFVSKLQDCPF